MIEVMKLKKMKSIDESSDDTEVEFSQIVKRPRINFNVSITSDIINPKNTKPKKSLNRKSELQRLFNSSFEENVQRRRTRSNKKLANREIRSNLRSAINIGLSMFRTVSQSLPKFLKYD